jgi:Tfp pilus assembly protein PilX
MTTPCKSRRRGAALLVCIFVIAVSTAIVVAMLEDEMLQMTALRHTRDYERALFLAGAGAHHALAELEADNTWRTGIPSAQFPAGGSDTYSATVVDDVSGDIIVTAAGTAGGVTRTVQVTIETN